MVIQADASHPCSACDGSGHVGKWTAAWLPGREQVGIMVCHVCLGAGRISDQMPARDAVADGETLHFYAEQERYIPPDGNLLIDVLVAYGAGPAWWFDRAYAIPVADTASMIAAYARAAFRAVPGLRG